MPDHQIDWGDSEFKTPKWESDEARRVRQAKHAREMEWQASVRRSKRITLLVKLPLLLVLLGGATVVGLDWSGVHRFGIFAAPQPTSDAGDAAVAAAAAGGAAPQAPAPVAPEAVVVPAVATEPLQARPIADAAVRPDPAELARLQDRLAHAESGIGVITRERDAKLVALRLEDQLLRGTYNPDQAHRLNDSLYVVNQRNAQRALELRAAARAGQAGAASAFSSQVTLIENVQARIQNTITNENHDVEVLKSLEARLAKAVALRDAAAGELKAAGGPP